MQIITLTSDFGVQSQGVGIMEAMIISIAPQVKVIHLMHGLPSFDLIAAARTMETARFMQTAIHVCICDPGVGTERKAIVLKVKRGDYLIGPDNGVLIQAGRVLGGITIAHEINNVEYMNKPVSPIFHGRDIFTPAAAHIANGVDLKDLGPALEINKLVQPPYNEAYRVKDSINATVIQINKFGSIHLNILHEDWKDLGIKKGELIHARVSSYTGTLNLVVADKFGDVNIGENIILMDDYGRVEIAINQNSFAEKYKIKIGDSIYLILSNQP